MARWLIGLAAVLLFAQGCSIQKRHYRDGWYIDRYHDSWESPLSNQNFTVEPADPDTVILSPVAPREIVVADSLIQPTDPISQKLPPVFSAPPQLGPKPALTFQEAQVSLLRKGLKMDPVLEFGYFASIVLMILTMALWPLSLALLIIALVKIRRYSSSGEDGAHENLAVAQHIVNHLLLAFLIMGILYVAMIGLIIYVTLFANGY